MYAIISACGKQYKVAEGDVVFMERLETEEGKEIVFEEVLLISEESKNIIIGDPIIVGAKVKATVIGHGKGKKFVVFKYKPKKNERKTRGHRWQYTKVQIESILADDTKKVKVSEKKETETKEVKKEAVKKTVAKKATVKKTVVKDIKK